MPFVQMMAPTSNTTNSDEKPVPEARHPDWEVFGKFEIDGLEIPSGDDLITMTKVSTSSYLYGHI